jgi:glycosyltransferase involved in cell wall biosynthesis
MGLDLALDLSAARVGGGASRVRELARTLSTLAPDLAYLVAGNRATLSALEHAPPHTRVVLAPGTGGTPTRVLWEHLLLPRIIARTEPRWVLSPFNVLPLGPGAAATRRAVIVSNLGPFAPQVRSVASGYQAMRNRVLRSLTVRSLAVADVVFHLSDEACRLLSDYLHGKTTIRLPMAPPPPDILLRAAEASADARGPYIVAVGDLMPHKGFEDAVRAVGFLRAHGHELSLLLCGSTVDPAYARRLSADTERSRGSTRFLGPLPQHRTLALMRGAVATVMCSRVENTSRVPVEAMAVGSPLVVTDVPSLREQCGPAADYYPPRDGVALAAAINRLLEDEPARRELVERGRRHIAGVDWLSATRVILETLELM